MQNYTLADYHVPNGVEIDDVRLPCIFCGIEIAHVNAGGGGWACGSVVDGASRVYLYCNARCRPEVMDGVELWRCGCVCDYTENVGPTCAECGRARDDHCFVESLDTAECQECDRTALNHPQV